MKDAKKRASEEAQRVSAARTIADCHPGWHVRLTDGRLVIIAWITSNKEAFVRYRDEKTGRELPLIFLPGSIPIARVERDQRYYLNLDQDDTEIDPVRDKGGSNG